MQINKLIQASVGADYTHWQINRVIDVGAQFIAPAWGDNPCRRAQLIAPLHPFFYYSTILLNCIIGPNMH